MLIYLLILQLKAKQVRTCFALKSSSLMFNVPKSVSKLVQFSTSAISLLLVSAKCLVKDITFTVLKPQLVSEGCSEGTPYLKGMGCGKLFW